MFKIFKRNKVDKFQYLTELSSKPQPFYKLSWYGLLNQIKSYFEERSDFKERKEQELLGIRSGLITSLKNELEKESQGIKDTVNTHIIHVDKKYKQILRDIKGESFIKGYRVTIVEPNKNLAHYDEVILIGLKKLSLVIEE